MFEMAIKTIAVEIEEEVKPLLDTLEGGAPYQQTPLKGSWQNESLQPALKHAEDFSKDLKPIFDESA